MFIRCSCVFVLSLFAVVLGTLGGLAQERAAKCLFEIHGSHYLGGPCKYQPLDRFGSFRIVDDNGTDIIAQVNITRKDEGQLTWRGPGAGNGGGQVVGSVSRQGACWIAADSSESGDDYNDSRLCAWTPGEAVYLGPSPKTPTDGSIIYVGSRVGMYEDVVSKRGIGSTNAQIITSPSTNGAIKFCREYSRDYSAKCISQNIKNYHMSSIVGNCKSKSFKDFDGTKFVFLGANTDKTDVLDTDYIIKNVSNGETLNSTTASGYDVELDIFKSLCPNVMAGEVRKGLANGDQER